VLLPWSSPFAQLALRSAAPASAAVNGLESRVGGGARPQGTFRVRVAHLTSVGPGDRCRSRLPPEITPSDAGVPERTGGVTSSAPSTTRSRPPGWALRVHFRPRSVATTRTWFPIAAPAGRATGSASLLLLGAAAHPRRFIERGALAGAALAAPCALLFAPACGTLDPLTLSRSQGTTWTSPSRSFRHACFVRRMRASAPMRSTRPECRPKPARIGAIRDVVVSSRSTAATMPPTATLTRSGSSRSLAATARTPPTSATASLRALSRTAVGRRGLLRDLRDLYLMAAECAIAWTLVGQAARGAATRSSSRSSRRARPTPRRR
jgi:hypothetical protein